jgi:hypothetical protein
MPDRREASANFWRHPREVDDVERKARVPLTPNEPGSDAAVDRAIVADAVPVHTID